MFIPESEYEIILRNMPILCVDLLIIYENKCLLLKRDNEPAKDEYWFSGGRIRKFETITEAAIRIAKEETNLDCEFIKIISIEETVFAKKINMMTDVHTVNICCHLVTSSITQLQIDKLHKDYKWVNSQNNSYHIAVNHALSLFGFNNNIAILNQNNQL